MQTMEDLELCLIKFNPDGTIKPKQYLENYFVESEEYRQVVIIIHDEYTFSANDGIRKVWHGIRDIFLQPKSHGQGIMTLEFLLPYELCFFFS